MKILHTVQLYSPSVGGAQEVVRQVSERLAGRGHEVTVATGRLPGRRERVLNSVRIEEFAIRGNAAQGIAGEAERYQRFLRGGDFDVMLNYAAQQWATDLAFPVLADLPYAKALATCGFSGLFLPAYSSYFAALPDALAHYDRVVLHSGSYRDADFVRGHRIDHVTVIPNGAAAEEFDARVTADFRARHGIPRDVPLVLTVANHTAQKGHSLVLEAFRRLRTPRAVLVLIGNAKGYAPCLRDCRRRARAITLRSLGRKRVLLCDPPRNEVIEAYQAADLFLFASSVECSPLVLFEAAASGTPFVSLAVGNAAEIADWTGAGTTVATDVSPEGFASADPAVLAAAVDDLLADRTRRARLAEAGKRAWRERFRWETIAEQYEELYATLVAERTALTK